MMIIMIMIFMIMIVMIMIFIIAIVMMMIFMIAIVMMMIFMMMMTAKMLQAVSPNRQQWTILPTWQHWLFSLRESCLLTMCSVLQYKTYKGSSVPNLQLFTRPTQKCFFWP